ncbi:hypothetical protein [Actinoplanes friuliensis]|uniref:hypothetical protein n=1 Tax=Actinoplanes friuliensis TaxID=196914 RepID=UPI001EE647D8|nr:hypothetical protein [Actinoplanes friuliensis]
MNLSDDLPPQRRPLFFPVVIATVFLSIIGMSAGLVLGSRHETPPQLNGPDDPNAYVPPEPTSQSVECPPQMHDTARKVLGYDVNLSQVLRVRTEDTDMSVWVCRDDAGELYYQANRGGDSGRWVEGQTALFLSGVAQGDDDYHATANDGNFFSVNESRLKIVFKNGKQETHPVSPE